MSRSRPHMFAAGTLIVLVEVALCVMAPRMYPLKASTSANFWYAATRVDLGVSQPDAEYVALDRDRLIWSMQWPFAVNLDQAYQTIPLTDVQADLPAVQRKLALRAADHHDEDFYAAAYVKWEAMDPRYRGIRDLLAFINAERRPSPYSAHFQEGLRRVSQTARVYWATFLFEALFFPALILFGFWPYVHRQSFRRKLLHLALLPVPLYIPMWLGYCNSASMSYPRGGILYPFVTGPMLALFSNREWEFSFLAHLPPFFLAITQGRAVSYADYYWMKSSIPTQLGPINVASLSAILVLLACGWRGAVLLYRKMRTEPRGFPVEIRETAAVAGEDGGSG